ncbi:MAG: hexitol phosphatase HxpB [Bacteroidetes bacterium]|nr:hexitol phosphatase HxpB [Bacteroidota bacterium]
MNYTAAIFDMDGILIDSEPFWRIAMIESFKSINIPFTDDDCKKTTGMRFTDVVNFWFKKYSISSVDNTSFENGVINKLVFLLKQNGKAIHNVNKLILRLKEAGFTLGLATSSPKKLMLEVVNILNMNDTFAVLESAQRLKFAKPHPQVFLNCAKKLNVMPQQCIVFEDSLNGVIASKAAQMFTIAVPDIENYNDKRFSIADCVCKNMDDALNFVNNNILITKLHANIEI